MKRVTGIFEGEKLDLEKITGKDNKLNVILYILSGHESIKMSVRDNNLSSALEAIPNREPIKLKAEVQTYKDELYLQALALLN